MDVDVDVDAALNQPVGEEVASEVAAPELAVPIENVLPKPNHTTASRSPAPSAPPKASAEEITQKTV